jgi:hypothetical protein
MDFVTYKTQILEDITYLHTYRIIVVENMVDYIENIENNIKAWEANLKVLNSQIITPKNKLLCTILFNAFCIISKILIYNAVKMYNFKAEDIKPKQINPDIQYSSKELQIIQKGKTPLKQQLRAAALDDVPDIGLTAIQKAYGPLEDQRKAHTGIYNFLNQQKRANLKEETLFYEVRTEYNNLVANKNKYINYKPSSESLAAQMADVESDDEKEDEEESDLPLIKGLFDLIYDCLVLRQTLLSNISRSIGGEEALQQELESLQAKVAEQGRTIEELQAEKVRLDSSLDAYTKGFEEQKKYLEQLGSQNEEQRAYAETRIKNLERQINDTRRQLESLNTRLKSKDEEISTLKHNVEQLEKGKESLENELVRIIKLLGAKEEQLQHLSPDSSGRNQIQKEIAELRQYLSNLQQQLQTKDVEITRLNQQLQAKDVEIFRLQSKAPTLIDYILFGSATALAGGIATYQGIKHKDTIRDFFNPRQKPNNTFVFKQNPYS